MVNWQSVVQPAPISGGYGSGFFTTWVCMDFWTQIRVCFTMVLSFLFIYVYHPAPYT